MVVPVYVFSPLSSRVPAPILVIPLLPPETTPETVILPLEAFMNVAELTNATGPLQLALLMLVLAKAPLVVERAPLTVMVPVPSRLNDSPETV